MQCLKSTSCIGNAMKHWKKVIRKKMFYITKLSQKMSSLQINCMDLNEFQKTISKKTPF